MEPSKRAYRFLPTSRRVGTRAERGPLLTRLGRADPGGAHANRRASGTDDKLDESLPDHSSLTRIRTRYGTAAGQNLKRLVQRWGWGRRPFPGISGRAGSPDVPQQLTTVRPSPPSQRSFVIAQWYASFGTAKSQGTRLFSLSGHVKKPGNYEWPIGTPLRALIYDEA